MTDDKFTRTGLGVYYHEMKGSNIRGVRVLAELLKFRALSPGERGELERSLDRVSEGLEKILRLLVSNAYADDPLATGLGKILSEDNGVSIDEFEFIDPVDIRKNRAGDEGGPF